MHFSKLDPIPPAHHTPQLTGITHYSPNKAHVFYVQIFAVMFLLPEMSPSMMQATILSAELEILASPLSPPSTHS